MNTHQLSVRLQGKPIGVLQQLNGKMSFSYLPQAEAILSLSMQDKKKYIPMTSVMLILEDYSPRETWRVKP